MRTPAICIDIDNVVAQTDEVMRQVIREHSSSHVDLAYDDVTCFDYWCCRDSQGRRLDKKEWTAIHEEFNRNYLLRIRPFEGVQRHLSLLSECYEVHLATSRLELGQENTRLWLAEHHIPFSELHFVTHGRKHLIQRKFLFAVDDDREQGYAFFAKGTSVLLLAHPWNAIGPYSPLGRVDGWNEIARNLLAIRK